MINQSQAKLVNLFTAKSTDNIIKSPEMTVQKSRDFEESNSQDNKFKQFRDRQRELKLLLPKANKLNNTLQPGIISNRSNRGDKSLRELTFQL